MHLLLPVLRKAIAKGVGHIRGRYGTSGGGEFREGRGDVLAARIEQAQAPMPVPGGVRPEFPRRRRRAAPAARRTPRRCSATPPPAARKRRGSCRRGRTGWLWG